MSDIRQRHDAIVEELARKYQGLGYQVLREPAEGIDIGGKSYRPDLIAKRGPETIVAEVKVVSRPEDNARWSQVADAINARPGWRFVLVLGAKERFEEYEIPAIKQIREYANEARRLLEISPAAAMLLAWASFEASARLALFRSGYPRERSAPSSLVSAAAQMGLLSPEEEAQLQRLVARRNRIAHGEFSAHVDSDDIRQLVTLSLRLLQDFSD